MIEPQIILQTIEAVVLSASVLLGVIYYTLTLRRAEKMKELTFLLEAVTNISQSIESSRAFADIVYIKEWKDYEDFVKNMVDNPETLANLMTILNTNNVQAWGLRRKLMDEDLFYETGGAGSIVEVWTKLEPFIKRWREEGEPKLYESLEWLYNKIIKEYPDILSFADTWGYAREHRSKQTA